MCSVLQQTIPYNPRVGFRREQPGMKTWIVIDLPPIRYVGIEVLIDRGLRRSGYFIAQFLVFLLEPVQRRRHRMPRSTLRDVEKLRPETVQVLLCQIAHVPHSPGRAGRDSPPDACFGSETGFPVCPALAV